MSVCKEFTPPQLAARLCKLIPELDQGEVLRILQMSGNLSFCSTVVPLWVEFFDSLVIDEDGVARGVRPPH